MGGEQIAWRRRSRRGAAEARRARTVLNLKGRTGWRRLPQTLPPGKLGWSQDNAASLRPPSGQLLSPPPPLQPLLTPCSSSLPLGRAQNCLRTFALAMPALRCQHSHFLLVVQVSSQCQLHRRPPLTTLSQVQPYLLAIACLIFPHDICHSMKSSHCHL